MSKSRFSDDSAERKALPITTGCLDYFPDALLAVSAVSKAGNDQHNPGEPLHWARGKSMDQADTIVRHLMERGEIDIDGHRHSAKMAWRALALLQLEIEEAKGLLPSRGSLPEDKPQELVGVNTTKDDPGYVELKPFLAEAEKRLGSVSGPVGAAFNVDLARRTQEPQQLELPFGDDEVPF